MALIKDDSFPAYTFPQAVKIFSVKAASQELQLNMEQSEENELLGEEELDDDCDTDVKGFVKGTAEDLMTDMKLEDEIDEVREKEPDFNWSYHIEIYPWNADDMTENFVRLIKLSQFSQIFMRKKGVGKENGDSEKIDDKLPGRLRKGCLHLYTDSWQNAKSIMRSATWKIMAAKNLTFEITKRGPSVGKMESAYLELDTYCASKTRFRDRTKGELKDRSAKVSNLPGTISREFLDVVFSRAYAVIGGTTVKDYLKEKEGKLHEKLLDVKDFNGSIDFDCLGRGSCRAFVLAHKNVFIEGQRVNIVANDKETMVVPPNTHDIGAKKKQEPEHTTTAPTKSFQSGRGRGNTGLHGISFPARGSFSSPSGRGFVKDSNLHFERAAGLAMIPPSSRPTSTPFTRSGPGMPVPMTGRQKMNEKMRRNNFVVTAGTAGCAGGGGTYAAAGGMMGARAPALSSVGDSFKQEIASLQSQLERSTQALEAKIAMLQQTTQTGSYFETDMAGFKNGGWEGGFDYNDRYINEDYPHNDGSYEAEQVPNFCFEGLSQRQPIRTISGIQGPNIGHGAGPKLHQGASRGGGGGGAPAPGMRRDMWRMRQGGRNTHENMAGYW